MLNQTTEDHFMSFSFNVQNSCSNKKDYIKKYVCIMAILAGINILKELQELQLKSLTLVNSLTLKNLE